MDYIHTLLFMEGDLNDEPSPDVLSLECNFTDEATTAHVLPEPGSLEANM